MAIDPLAYAKDYTAEDTSAKYTCVKKGSASNSYVQATAATDIVIGVTGDLDSVSGNKYPIIVFGPAKIKLGGTVVPGTRLVATTAGKVIGMTRHTHTENTAGSYTQNATTGAAAADYTVGIALEDGVSGDTRLCFVIPGQA